MCSPDAVSDRPSPLAGLRVVELARVLAGPFAGQTLADLGADVIKVESPEGDGTRQWGPPWIEHDGERAAAYYHACNRGKRSIVADFTDPHDRAMVANLCAGADVVIENFKAASTMPRSRPRIRVSSIARSPVSARTARDARSQDTTS